MLRNKLVRSDGSIIDSSVIISCEFTEEVNSNTNLTVGDVTASELTVEIRNTASIQQGEVLTYSIIEDGVEKQIGIFNAEKPTQATRTSMRFSAYDNIIKLEKPFSDWLRNNQSQFPMSLGELVDLVCSHCGVGLATQDFPHADLPVDEFYADDLTCRQVLSWAAAIAGRFVRANAEGELEFAWYADYATVMIAPYDVRMEVTDDGNGNVSILSKNLMVVDDGAGNVTLSANGVPITTGDTGIALGANGMARSVSEAAMIPFLRDKLSYENYATDLIERVQINHSDDDVGVIYPADATGNCFTISGNMILGTMSSENVELVAQGTYEHLETMTYVPFGVTLPRTIMIRAGDRITITDSGGNTFETYVMKVGVTPSGTTLSATGDKSYGSNAAVSSEKYSNLTGKILSIKKSVDGLEIKNEDLAGKVSAISVTVDGIDTFVGNKIDEALGDYDVIVGNKLSQTAEGWDYQFGVVTGDLSDLSDEVREQLEAQKANIRFEDGNILLGRASSEIMLILKNDRISFVRNVVGYPELAYVSDDVLYITEGEFMNQLRIGKFGFTPGVNGNLSFKKVVE